MTDGIFFHVGATLMYTLLDQLSGRRGAPAPETLWHRGKALSVLRKELARPAPQESDALLLSILIMGLIEVGKGKTKSW